MKKGLENYTLGIYLTSYNVCRTPFYIMVKFNRYEELIFMFSNFNNKDKRTNCSGVPII